MSDFRQRQMIQEAGSLRSMAPAAHDREDEARVVDDASPGGSGAQAAASGDSDNRIPAGYWKVKAVRAASESEVQAREIKRLRLWMEELQREMEDLRRIQQKSEEAIYEQMMDLPGRPAGLESVGAAAATSAAPAPLEVVVRPSPAELQAVTEPLRAQVLALQGELEAIRARAASLELDVEAARRERDTERERASAVEQKLAARLAAEEARVSAAQRLEALLMEQERHVHTVESKLSKLDGQLIAARDAERGDQPVTQSVAPFDLTAASGQGEKSGRRWRRIQSLFTPTEI